MFRCPCRDPARFSSRLKPAVGGLGHVAIQYAKAMGLKAIGLDIAEDKLALARVKAMEAQDLAEKCRRILEGRFDISRQIFSSARTAGSKDSQR